MLRSEFRRRFAAGTKKGGSGLPDMTCPCGKAIVRSHGAPIYENVEAGLMDDGAVLPVTCTICGAPLKPTQESDDAEEVREDEGPLQEGGDVGQGGEEEGGENLQLAEEGGATPGDAQEAPVKRRPGRPKGSRNKPKVSVDVES